MCIRDSGDTARSLALARSLGCRCGLALNPAVPLDECEPFLDRIDLLLLMSVNPGFGGQKFIPATLDKLRRARRMLDAHPRDILLQVDGGVTTDNIADVGAAGADAIVAGTAIFGAADYAQTIARMRRRLRAA